MIRRIRLKPFDKSQSCIPLCHLRCLPLLRLINEIDVAQLENEFVIGCHDGDRALYVSPYDNLNEVLHVSNDIHGFWGSLWQEANKKFDTML